MKAYDANERLMHERLDSVVSYMRNRRFDKALFRKVYRYYVYLLTKKTAIDEAEVLGVLPDSLKEEVSHFLAKNVFHRTHLFGGVDGIAHAHPELMVEILTFVKPYRVARVGRSSSIL